MSNTDSFIDEVTEEVRRDRVYKLTRRYGWIAVLAVFLLVGGAAWNEWRKADAEAQAQALGDAILSALANNGAADRAEALAGVTATDPGGRAILEMLRAAALTEDAQNDAAAEALMAVAADGEVPQIYRDIAAFKALTATADSMEPDALRLQLEALARPGSPIRLLAEEQLALLDVRTGATDDALTRLARILQDAELTPGLRQRASQLIVALGGDLTAT